MEAERVEAVVFDVGRVLVEWDLRHLFAKLVSDPEELEFVLAEVVSEDWHFQHDAGRELGEMVAERKARFPRHAALIDAYATRFGESIPGPVPGTQEIAKELHARDVPLYAITNFADTFWDEFAARQPVTRLFRDVVVSGKERLAKPDPAIFRLAEARFGHEAGAMLFIDDNAENIGAAAALGWEVHHFTHAEKLRQDLAARGLLQ